MLNPEDDLDEAFNNEWLNQFKIQDYNKYLMCRNSGLTDEEIVILFSESAENQFLLFSL